MFHRDPKLMFSSQYRFSSVVLKVGVLHYHFQLYCFMCSCYQVLLFYFHDSQHAVIVTAISASTLGPYFVVLNKLMMQIYYFHLCYPCGKHYFPNYQKSFKQITQKIRFDFEGSCSDMTIAVYDFVFFQSLAFTFLQSHYSYQLYSIDKHHYS